MDFGFSCASSACACAQTGNHSDSGSIDNEKLTNYRMHNIQSHNGRSKNNSLVISNGQKTKAARIKSGAEPIYVNQIHNQSVNFNINNNHLNDISNEHDYYDAINYEDVTKAELLVNINKTKSNYKLMGKPPSGEKHLRSFCGLSLDEREMPITRERSKLTPTNHTKRSIGDAKKPLKLAGSPKLLRASTCDAYPSRTRNR